jgi:hypothetical protein
MPLQRVVNKSNKKEVISRTSTLTHSFENLSDEFRGLILIALKHDGILSEQ